MEKMKVKGLSGVIMSSANPERLAKFYNDVMGIPLAISQHGDSPDHFECDYHGIHFAILKLDEQQEPNNNLVPSFYIESIDQFTSQHNIKLIDEVMDLGNALSGGFKDPDGNTIRIWMPKK